MNKMLVAVAALVAPLAFATTANAAVTLDSSDVGNSFTVDYNGFDNPDGLMGTLAGLSASATFTLTSIVGTTFNFGYSVVNTSFAPGVTDSRVSVFGFTTAPAASSVTLFTPPGSVFTAVGANSNVPNLLGSDANRVCFRAGAGGAQCAGGSGDGVEVGDPAATGTFALGFAAGTTSIDLDRFFVRYQSIVGPGFNSQNDSATGLGTISVIPEPAAWAMMIGGFGIVGGMLRFQRRRRTVLA